MFPRKRKHGTQAYKLHVIHIFLVCAHNQAKKTTDIRKSTQAYAGFDHSMVALLQKAAIREEPP